MKMVVEKKNVTRPRKVYQREDGSYLMTCGKDADWCFTRSTDVRIFKKDLPKQFEADVYDDWDV